MKRIAINALALFIILCSFTTTIHSQEKKLQEKSKGNKMTGKVEKTDKEWKKTLTSEEYRVLRQKGTERPYTGKYWNTFEDGIYKCAACDASLFDSKTKFDSGCGWPSFSDILENKNILTKDDLSYGMHRIEVLCANCEGHLGHVFEDGPKPTGLRYCINSVSIKFESIKK